MKKLLLILPIILAGCSNPDIIRPYNNGPTYYKIPECYMVQRYPNNIHRRDGKTGHVDTYITTQPTLFKECNYNPYMYGYIDEFSNNTGSLSQAVYGTM